MCAAAEVPIGTRLLPAGSQLAGIRVECGPGWRSPWAEWRQTEVEPVRSSADVRICMRVPALMIAWRGRVGNGRATGENATMELFARRLRRIVVGASLFEPLVP